MHNKKGGFIMDNRRNIIVIAVLIVAALCFSGCCGPKPAPYESTMATERVAPPVVVQEPEPVVEEAPPPPSLAESAAAAGALQNVYFDFDKSALTPAAIAKLDKTAAWMQKTAEAKVEIQGHCDERGTNEYNMALGERRANSAEKYLVNLGVSSDRISTVSYGEERPADPGHDEAAWAKNRRCEFKIAE